MHTFQQGTSRKNKKLNTIFGSIAFGLLIAAAYLTFTQHHSAVAINIWQVKMMGDNKYFPVLTIFLLALPVLLVLLIVKVIIVKLIKK
jgi:hypothetical protein